MPAGPRELVIGFFQHGHTNMYAEEVPPRWNAGLGLHAGARLRSSCERCLLREEY